MLKSYYGQDYTYYDDNALTNFVSVSPPKTSGQNEMNGFKRSHNLTAGLDYERVSGAIFTRHEQRKKIH